jgi:phage baseplate assembly protein W
MNGTFQVRDVELVKLDLLNHIFTRRGERVRMPRFGTIIPDLAFEPLDEDTLDALQSELREVFDFDPRVELISLSVDPNPDGHTVTARCLLRYIELDLTDQMNLNIQFGEGGV